MPRSNGEHVSGTGHVQPHLFAHAICIRFCRQALLALPNTIGVTATLELAYKKPTFANQFVVVRADLKELKGRKAWVEGHIEDLDGQVLVEGK
jgi:acyl-CoA thioesterase FadM